MKSVAIVVPAFNEEECIPELVRRLSSVFESEPNYAFTCYLVENGSTDSTWDRIIDAALMDHRFVGIQLSRNFGADGGFSAGLDFVSEDAVILMTADLQDPPELISSFLMEWRKGIENVYGVVEERGGTGVLRRVNSQVFYWLAGRLTDDIIPRNASDFRLLDKSAYQAVRSLRERNKVMRGVAAWVGFSSKGIPIRRPSRFAGESKASTKTVLEVASRSIFSNSTKPLRMITFAGLSLCAISIVAICVLGLLWVFRGVPFAGFGTLVSVILMGFGLISLMIGIVAEYLGLVYDEVKERPSFIVRQHTRSWRQ